MENNIKKWYQLTFPSDELGKEINTKATFEELVNNLPSVYEYLNIGDSIIRERVFVELSLRMDVDYNYIYSKWLGVGYNELLTHKN